MSTTCVLWYAPRSNTGLSRHGDPMFPHFCPLNQDLDQGPCTGIFWGCCVFGLPVRHAFVLRVANAGAECSLAPSAFSTLHPWLSACLAKDRTP